MSFPSFLIIGAMKAGTSSLHNYLSLHPEIFMSKDKELNFFNTSLNWNKGLDWYKEQFDDNYKVKGETSPNYSKWEGTAERVYSVLPNIKIIYLLRNPVERFVSQCNHMQMEPNQLVDNLRLGKTIEIFTNGLYSKWYQEFLKYYSREQILLVTSEALRESKKDTLIRIFDFLEVNPNTYNYDEQLAAKEAHVTSNKKIASGSVKHLNSRTGFGTLKTIATPLKPLLKPIWDRLFYHKGIILDLTLENKDFLLSQYQPDLQMLAELTGIKYYNGNA